MRSSRRCTPAWADFKVTITELREAFYDLIEDHCINIRFLADTLGYGNTLVEELEQGCGQIIETAKIAIILASASLFEPEDDWVRRVNFFHLKRKRKE